MNTKIQIFIVSSCSFFIYFDELIYYNKNIQTCPLEVGKYIPLGKGGGGSLFSTWGGSNKASATMGFRNLMTSDELGSRTQYSQSLYAGNSSCSC